MSSPIVVPAPGTSGRARALDRRRALDSARRWRWRALLALLALFVAGTFGVTTATARGSLGPHEARFDVTTDSRVTVDLGPLGTIELDSPLPLTLGVRATVQEIPQGVTDLTQAATLNALNSDLSQYVAFFSGTKAVLRDVAVALVEDAVVRTLLALLALLVAWFAGGLLLGRRRRAELVVAMEPHRRQLVAAGLVVVLGATVLTSSLPLQGRSQTQSVPVSSVFDGTPLAGARITGRLGGLIDTYSGQVVAAYQANEVFYAGAKSSLDVAWAHWQRTGEPVSSPTRAPAAGGPSAGPSPTPSGSSSGSPSAAAAAVEPVTIVLVADLHCNVGMARVMGALVQLSGAQIVLDAGDTTINGTSVEEQCVSTFASAVPKGVRLVTAPGNHDSLITTKAYAKAGATVLLGKVVTVDGIRFFGDADPSQTLFGASVSNRHETEAQAGARIAGDVCAARDVDVLLIHNPRVGTATLDRDCVPAQLSGHMHVRTDPQQVGGGIRYISSSTAGARVGQPTLGPLHGTAELTVLRWDPASRQIVSWQLVEIGVDGRATVHDPMPWPQIATGGPSTPAPEPTGGD